MTPDLRPFLIEYRLDGATFGATIEAYDQKDALRRVRQIGITGEVCGPLVAEVVVWPGAARWRRLWQALKGLVAS